MRRDASKPLKLDDERRELAAQYVPLAYKLILEHARKHPRHRDEIESAALYALSRAARDWSPDHEGNFMTYAHRAISNQIHKAIRDSRIPLGFRVREDDRRRRFKSRGKGIRQRRKYSSPEAPKVLVRESPPDLPADTASWWPDYGFPVEAEADLEGWLESRLSLLSPKAAGVVRMHFGLDGSRPMSLRMIGDWMGMSYEAVRQIEIYAFRVMAAFQSHTSDAG